MSDHVICFMTTNNSFTLDHSIVKNWLLRGYIGYQNLVGKVDATTVGQYRKAINHKGAEKTTTEANIVNIPSAKNIGRDSM